MTLSCPKSSANSTHLRQYLGQVLVIRSCLTPCQISIFIQMEKHGRSRSLSIPAAIAKLRDTAEVITRRGGLKKSELKRIPEAVAALTSSSANDIPSTISKNRS